MKVMTEAVKAWQCIGCGKIEAPQTCIGVCQDRKVEFVYAPEHKDALDALAQARRRLDLLEALARQLAGTNPRGDGWERSYRAMQERARSALAAIASDVDPAGGGARAADAEN
jgi:hypothetical protein